MLLRVFFEVQEVLFGGWAQEGGGVATQTQRGVETDKN